MDLKYHVIMPSESTRGLYSSSLNLSVDKGNNTILDEVLYEEVVPVRLSCQTRDDKVGELTVKITMHTPQSPQNTDVQRMLCLKFTDEADPYFLYTLEVNEGDFQHLKKDQQLLVDFSTFPTKMVDYLNQCIACAQQESPKFVALLDAGAEGAPAVFSVIETNPFKHLQHIALRFRPGNDEAVKR